ncbi:FUSC family protein, partial [Paraburkholderia sp. SIMBA_049]
INGLELLLSQLAYDHTRPDLLTRAHELRGRMQLLLPLMSALADPLIALMRDLHVRPPALDALLADAAKWFDAPLPALRDGTDGAMADDPV